MKKPFWIILIFTACSELHPGFRPIDAGCYFRLEKLGTDDVICDSASFVALTYTFCTDPYCHDTGASHVMLTDGTLTGICKGLNGMSPGDEFMLLLEGRYGAFPFPEMDRNSETQTFVRAGISAVLNEREYSGNDDFRDTLFWWREQRIIERYKLGDSVKYEAFRGCFRAILHTGEGALVEDGREIALSYRGFFLDDREFDNTENLPDPFTIVYGKPHQIIYGLATAISGLRAGTETKIILPSHLAFGKNGSSTGIVPPDEPLVYQLKIISVK